MKKTEIIILATLCLFFKTTNAQNVGIGTANPHPSAALEIADSSKGILIPRMTMSQRNAIQNPAEGLMVYQTDSIRGYWYWDGLGWKTSYNSNNVDSLINSGQSKGIRIGFSTSTTWVVPNDVHMITVELWGASGGGGGGSGNLYCSQGADGGNGGKGGYSRSNIPVVPGDVHQINIGQSGIGGNPGPWTQNSIGASLDYTPNWGRDGTSGGNTSFSYLLTAQGGAGGIGGHIYNCIRYSISGQDGVSNNFNYPLNSNAGNRLYIPSNFVTQYPTLPMGGSGGAGQYPAFGGGGTFPSSGSNGQDGYCIISY